MMHLKVLLSCGVVLMLASVDSRSLQYTKAQSRKSCKRVGRGIFLAKARHWCCNCEAGFFKADDCSFGLPRTTNCAPYEFGPGDSNRQTYTPTENNYTQCFKSPNDHLCQNSTNTFYVPAQEVCCCQDDHFNTGDSESILTDGCIAHSPCPPGSQPAVKGTALSDTVCEKCPDGTYSIVSSTTLPCEPFSLCKPGEAIYKQGSSTSDVVCDNRETTHLNIEGYAYARHVATATADVGDGITTATLTWTSGYDRITRSTWEIASLKYLDVGETCFWFLLFFILTVLLVAVVTFRFKDECDIVWKRKWNLDRNSNAPAQFDLKSQLACDHTHIIYASLWRSDYKIHNRRKPRPFVPDTTEDSTELKLQMLSDRILENNGLFASKCISQHGGQLLLEDCMIDFTKNAFSEDTMVSAATKEPSKTPDKDSAPVSPMLHLTPNTKLHAHASVKLKTWIAPSRAVNARLYYKKNDADTWKDIARVEIEKDGIAQFKIEDFCWYWIMLDLKVALDCDFKISSRLFFNSETKKFCNRLIPKCAACINSVTREMAEKDFKSPCSGPDPIIRAKVCDEVELSIQKLQENQAVPTLRPQRVTIHKHFLLENTLEAHDILLPPGLFGYFDFKHIVQVIRNGNHINVAKHNADRIILGDTTQSLASTEETTPVVVMNPAIARRVEVPTSDEPGRSDIGGHPPDQSYASGVPTRPKYIDSPTREGACDTSQALLETHHPPDRSYPSGEATRPEYVDSPRREEACGTSQTALQTRLSSDHKRLTNVTTESEKVQLFFTQETPDHDGKQENTLEMTI